MNLAKKYDKSLRNKIAMRAVWLPGTEVKVGDIMLMQDGVLTSLGNIADEGIEYTEQNIGDEQAIKVQAQGVTQSIFQGGAIVSLNKLDGDIEAELKLSFNTENSYFLRTPKLTGKGLAKGISVARKIAKLKTWDPMKNYVVHKIWRAEEFTFLASIEKGHDITFKGTGEAIQNILEMGISAGVSSTGTGSMSFESIGKGGPIVMQVFRVKRNGDIF